MVRVSEDGDYLVLESPYNAKFVDALKDAIPSEDREYKDKVWKIDMSYSEEIQTLILHFYPDHDLVWCCE